VFLALGLTMIALGLIPYLQYAIMVLVNHGEKISGHLQSLVAGAVLIILGFLVAVLGVVADLLSINRKLLEDALLRLKRVEYRQAPYDFVPEANPVELEEAEVTEVRERKHAHGYAPTFGEFPGNAR
jgi:hypothetical protein